jgi:hypothetical protein
MHTVAPLRDGLDDVLERGGRNVLVDPTGVTFLESTTLAGSRRFLRGTGTCRETASLGIRISVGGRSPIPLRA